MAWIARALEDKLPGFFKKYTPEYADNFSCFLQPLRDIHLHSADINYQMNWNQTDNRYVQIFSAVALLILIIGCINFMNLATARSSRRAREVGLRKVMGSSRTQLIRQFLGESVFLAFASMLLALVLIELSMPFLNEYFGNVFDFNYSRNGIYLLELAGIALFTGIFAGIYPAFFLSSFKPATVLKGVLKDGSRGLWLRRTFIVLQFFDLDHPDNLHFLRGQADRLHAKPEPGFQQGPGGDPATSQRYAQQFRNPTPRNC